MTNEEKAREIANLHKEVYISGLENERGTSFTECASSAYQMAEWKDNILREEREKAIEKFNLYYDKKLNMAIASRYVGIVFFVDKLLGEDSRDKLHCAFATLDNQ